jgi:hypothetical protein
MRLTPGVAVFRAVFAKMDTDADGTLSEAEQRAYIERVLRDLSLTVDGERLPLRLVSWKFGTIEEMKAGRGDIELEISADVPRRSRSRRLIFENHHQSRIAAYLVNCLVPRDPDIQVTAQRRNYLQSRYELDYAQAGVRSGALPFAGRSGVQGALGAVSLLLLTPLAWRWRRRGVAGKSAIARKDGLSAHRTVSPEGRGL